MLIAKDNSESKFAKLPLPEAGTTQAVCCAVWDLGLQETSFNGEKKVQHKIIVAWEITEKINAPESEYNDKPYMLNRKYTLSLGEKANLRKDLESWRGLPFTADELQNGFDLDKLYGANCYIGIKHEPDRNDPSKVYANVTAILPIPKGMEKITPLRARDEPPPKWVQEKIAQAIIPDEQPMPDYDIPQPEPEESFPF
jgi:hypothetical protein